MRHRGFTLIELAVVLAIMAILAAAVTLRVQHRMGAATLDDAIGAIGHYDRTTRLAARSQGRPLVLAIDVNEGRIERLDLDGRTVATPMRVASTIRLTEVMIGPRRAYGSDAAVRVSTQGWTPPYALCLRGAGRTRWLMVAGLTGIVTVVDDEQQAQEILDAAQSRPDAG